MIFDYAVVLTGGIATGKSTVAEFFTAYGFEIIDADKIAHQVLNQEHLKIAELFGEEYVENQEVKRKHLGRLIFSNPKEKQRLEELLHPIIYKKIEEESLILDVLKKPYLIDIPLFFESKRYPIRKSIVVYTPQTIQLQRLMKRDNSSKKEALLRIQSQLDIEQKKQQSSYIIDNSLDLKHLKQECDKIKNMILIHYKGL